MGYTLLDNGIKLHITLIHHCQTFYRLATSLFFVIQK